MQVSGTTVTQSVVVTDADETDVQKLLPNAKDETLLETQEPVVTELSALAQANQTPPPEPAVEEEETQVYWIGSDIVSETVFNQYDLNGDGIISEAEQAAYEKAKEQSDDGSLDITA
jgi:hypothetical protein